MSESSYLDITAQLRQAAVAAGRDPSEITLIAVSKGHPAEAIEALYRLGHRDFGESYVQELLEKATLLAARGCTELRWHFIGHLQTNKVKALLPLVHAIHAVDSERLARELAKRWSALGRGSPLPVFVEVNIDAEEGKSGVAPEEAPALAAAVGTLGGQLSLQGLMCIPQPGTDDEAAQAFARLRECDARCPESAHRLSMGMSDDFPIAIREGATHIRVGTAIFGERTPRRPG